MACFHPVRMWRCADGSVLSYDSSKHDLIGSFMRPCGQCVGCRVEYSSMWATRFMHEAMLHKANCVVTLTYDDDHLPYRGMINYPDVQKCIRKLRKENSGQLIRFGVGSEYGERLGRPHHHVILFGYDFPDKVSCGKSKSGSKLWTSEYAAHIWPHGFSLIGELDLESAGYIARYCVKKVNGRDAVAHYRRVDSETGEIYQLPPECMHVSTHPGIGSGFYERFRHDLFPGNGVSHVVMRGGLELKMPRYYDKLEAKAHPAELLEVKVQRELAAEERAADCTPERLAVREVVARAALALKGERV